MSTSTIKTTPATPAIKGRGGRIPVAFKAIDETYRFNPSLFYVTTVYVINNNLNATLNWALTTEGNYQFAWAAGPTSSAPANGQKVEDFEIQRGNLGSNPAGEYEIFTSTINYGGSVIELQLKFVTTSTWGSDMYANVLLDGTSLTNGWFSSSTSVTFTTPNYDTIQLAITFPYGGQFYDDAVFSFTQYA